MSARCVLIRNRNTYFKKLTKTEEEKEQERNKEKAKKKEAKATATAAYRCRRD